MAKLKLLSDAEVEQAQWVDYDVAPFAGDVRFLLLPKTRSLILKATEEAKRDPVYRRHKVFDKGRGTTVVRNGDEDEAFIRALADLLVQDWEGIDFEGGPAECNKENKIRLFQSLELAAWVSRAAGDLVVAQSEEEKGNS